MRIIERYWDPGLFDDEPKECTSCGVVMHTGELKPGGYPRILFVEQMDQPNRPWGIPAGRTEAFETKPTQTIRREVMEEVGIDITEEKFEHFFKIPALTDNKIKIVYKTQVSFDQLGGMRAWKYENGLLIRDRNTNEIGRMVLVAPNELFERGNPIITHYYRWDVLHWVKAELEGLWVI